MDRGKFRRIVRHKPISAIFGGIYVTPSTHTNKQQRA